jgi:hypothetical protein
MIVLDPHPQAMLQFEQPIPHHMWYIPAECNAQQQADYAQMSEDLHFAQKVAFLHQNAAPECSLNYWMLCALAFYF